MPRAEIERSRLGRCLVPRSSDRAWGRCLVPRSSDRAAAGRRVPFMSPGQRRLRRCGTSRGGPPPLLHSTRRPTTALRRHRDSPTACSSQVSVSMRARMSGDRRSEVKEEWAMRPGRGARCHPTTGDMNGTGHPAAALISRSTKARIQREPESLKARKRRPSPQQPRSPPRTHRPARSPPAPAATAPAAPAHRQSALHRNPPPPVPSRSQSTKAAASCANDRLGAQLRRVDQHRQASR